MIGALAGFATGGRGRLFVAALVGITVMTVAAFIVMAWHVEAEGGAGMILWWTVTTAGAAAVCAGLIAVARRVST